MCRIHRCKCDKIDLKSAASVTRLTLLGGLPSYIARIQELRELWLWSEGHVWTIPERHGAMTGCHEIPNRLDSTRHGCHSAA